MDNFNTLSRRLLNRAPAVGIALAGQFINDSWHSLQAMRQWSWRRGNSTFAPPTLYNTGQASSNSASGQPTLITGTGTTWTPSMIGSQIRVGGLLYPFYTIVGWLSATQIVIDQPWAGQDVIGQSYTIQQIYFPVPDDFNYFLDNCVVSIKDGYRLWTSLTQAELDMMDPQRTNYGQTYAVVFRDYSTISAGVVYPPLPLGSYVANPASATTGYTYPASATYLVQIQTGGATGTATFVWTRIGTSGFSFPITTQEYAQDLSDGVQIYFPDATWTSGNSWIINAQPTPMTGGPRYELWPGPTYSAYLYPYQYIKKEYDISEQSPQLPPFVANRGEVLLEMALEKCAEFPGADAEHPNPYYNLKQAVYHAAKVDRMMVDFERNDEEIGVTNISYEVYPMYPSPWNDGRWQQHHSPAFL